MSDFTLTNVRPWGADPVDIEVNRGLIERILPAGSGVIEGRRVEGDGMLALPGFINAHAHVDKSWWGQPWVSYGGEPGTAGRIAHERAARSTYGIPSLDSTIAVMREFLGHGTTAIRTHVDVDLEVGLRGIESVRAAAAALGGALQIELVAFPQDGVIRRPGVMELLDRAVAEGAENVGGLDPCTIDFDPLGQLDGLFDIATRRSAGIDIHLHNGGDLGAWQYQLLIDRTLEHGMQGRVNVSHGFALGDLDGAAGAEMVAQLSEAGISWTTVAPPLISPLPIAEIRERGMLLGLGTDGIRDLWAPFGDGDVLRVALNFARLHGLVADGDLAYAVELASRRAAPFVHRDTHDLVEGARADIVLLDAENIQDALVRAPVRKMVVAGGRIVARRGDVLV